MYNLPNEGDLGQDIMCYSILSRFTLYSSLNLWWRFQLSLNKEQIKYLAVLSRMDIKEDEIQDVVEKLSSIVEFVDQLQAITTDGTEPMAHPLAQGQRLRIDEITEYNERDKIQLNAKNINKGMYLVPKVID